MHCPFQSLQLVVDAKETSTNNNQINLSSVKSSGTDFGMQPLSIKKIPKYNVGLTLTSSIY